MRLLSMHHIDLSTSYMCHWCSRMGHSHHHKLAVVSERETRPADPHSCTPNSCVHWTNFKSRQLMQWSGANHLGLKQLEQVELQSLKTTQEQSIVKLKWADILEKGNSTRQKKLSHLHHIMCLWTATDSVRIFQFWCDRASAQSFSWRATTNDIGVHLQRKEQHCDAGWLSHFKKKEKKCNTNIQDRSW